MLFHHARPVGRVLLTTLAALAGSAWPLQAAPPRVAPWPVVDAVDDEYSLTSGAQIEILAPGVAANDQVPAGARVLIGLVSGPAHGTLKLGADGDFAYVPVRGFTGTDTFRYGISNRHSKDEANVVLHVLGQVDVALTATAIPAHVSPGQTSTITFRLVNQGPTDAEGVRLDVTVPTRLSGAHVRPDGRCTKLPAGQWACPMGALPVGGSITASFDVTPAAPGSIEASGMAVAPNDGNPLNDYAEVTFDAGRLLLDPAHVTVRLPWSPPARPVDPFTLEASLSNATVALLTYDVQAVGSPGAPPAWLAIEPASGTVDPMDVRATKLVFSSVGVSPGLQRAWLHFAHDSVFTLNDVPVSFTVAFRDVPADRTDDASIHALAGAGVTAGCRAGSFCPDRSLTRAGASVWLLLSAEGVAYQPPPARGLFADVAIDRPDAAFVEDAVSRGVIDACASNPALLFCPDLPLARADAAVVVLRMIEGPDYEPPLVVLTFRDLVNDPRAMFVEDAVRRGLFTDCSILGNDLFCPDEGLTRGDAAVALVKAFNLPLF